MHRMWVFSLSIFALFCAVGVCANCSFSCDDGFHQTPVCGSDDVTYANACTLDERNCRATDMGYVTIRHLGECSSINDVNVADERKIEHCLRVGRKKYLKC
ncbi:predicted protein [Nematostella vectensis]|uniref:Kazal-like domain-containing protein n=1 Tax=Nematostella vectensis TaxID=45351 RepID=A7RRM4_NEMVE|nr:follistatin [Nematostella vectensis]EDO45853.1 predicted protein [Nematostella vectensis]|eukprot:XP_001637916.1 predicted protein [Nematostella vectensis]